MISRIHYSNFNLISRLTAETLYKQLQLLDRLITHHHPFSRTSQLERLYLPKSKDEDEVLRNKRDDDNEELQEEHHPYLFGNPISQVRLCYGNLNDIIQLIRLPNTPFYTCITIIINRSIVKSMKVSYIHVNIEIPKT